MFEPVSDRRFPRSQTLLDMLQIIKRYPSLGKDASSVLIGLGEAIHVNAALNEIDVLIKSTIAAEVYVRNSALQCLQVKLKSAFTGSFSHESFTRLWI